MKLLFLVNTHYQLLIAVRLAMTVYKDNPKDIIISDHSSHFREIHDQIKNIDIFNNAFFSNDKSMWHIKDCKKLLFILGLLKNKPTLVKKCVVNHGELNEYDAICCYNREPYLVLLMRYCNISEVILFQESYLCHFRELILTKGALLSKKIYELLTGKKIFDRNMKMYFDEPELVGSNIVCQPIKLPQIELKPYINILNKIYDYQNYREKYEEKYIFFETSYFTDGINISDEQLIVSIVEKVGKDNFIVKLHPRTKINRFAKHGIKTVEASHIPFELVCLNEHIENKYLITIQSSSVIEAASIFGSKNKVIMLFKLLQGVQFVSETTVMLDTLKQHSGIDVIVPESEERLYNLL